MIDELTRAYRRRLGITQEGLAERTGISVRAIRAIETGRSTFPRRGTLRRLADAFGLSVAERDSYLAVVPPRLPPQQTPGPVSSAPSSAPSSVPGSAELPEPSARKRPVPEQLPAAVAGFAGRRDVLARLDALLDAGTTTTVVISGDAGAGKTALAVYWGHRVADRFPDGRLYVDLRGFDPGQEPVTSADAVRACLDALGVPPHRMPADPMSQAGLYRSLLARRRMLVVADGARDADQVRPLIPGAPGCLVLVTSRRHLASLVAIEGAFPIALDPLGADELGHLLIG